MRTTIDIQPTFELPGTATAATNTAARDAKITVAREARITAPTAPEMCDPKTTAVCDPELCDCVQSLAECLIAAVQSNLTDPPAAYSVVERYRAYRAARGQANEEDGIRALLRTFEEVGTNIAWAGKVGSYRRRYSPSSCPVAADEIEHAAELLYAQHVNSLDDLRRALSDTRTASALERGLSEITGESSVLADVAQLAGLTPPDGPHAQLSDAQALTWADAAVPALTLLPV